MKSELKETLSHIKKHTLPPLTDDCYIPIGKYRGTGKTMSQIPVDYYVSLVKLHTESPRVYRGPHWMRVMDYIKGFKNK